MGMGSSQDPHSSLAPRTSRRPLDLGLERQPERAERPFLSAAAASSPSTATAAAGSYAGAAAPAAAAGNDSKPLAGEGEEARKARSKTVSTVAEEARAFAERERRLAEKRHDEVSTYLSIEPYRMLYFESVRFPIFRS